MDEMTTSLVFLLAKLRTVCDGNMTNYNILFIRSSNKILKRIYIIPVLLLYIVSYIIELQHIKYFVLCFTYDSPVVP